MKSALFVNTFLHGRDQFCELDRRDRLPKFLEFYWNLKERLGFEQIYITDNGGDDQNIYYFLTKAWKYEHEMTLIRRPYQKRGPGHPIYDNLPNWRAFYDYRIPIIDGFDKIYIFDDDAFIVSGRMVDHLAALTSGWETFWCPKYGFPEFACQVLCQDAFGVYLDFVNEKPYAERNRGGVPIEQLIPWTNVNKDFKTDRWGETHTPQEDWMDGYFQCPADMRVTFRET